MNKLGFVDVEKGWKWLNSLEEKLEKERWNGRINTSGRKCIWYGVGVDLGFRNKVFEGEKISQGLRKRGNDLWGGDDWNSILVYKYDVGCELKDHIDRDVFDNKVVIVNFCKGLISGFRYDDKVYWLKNGEVVEIDNKKRHGVLVVNDVRWSVSFRKVI